FFAATKRDKRWNSTKDTALIVFAMCDYLDRQKVDPKAAAKVTFRVNDAPATTVTLKGAAELHSVKVPPEQVRRGVNTVTFPEATPGVLYRVVARYRPAERDQKAQAHGLTVERSVWLLDGASGLRLRQLKPGETVPVGSYLEMITEIKRQDGERMTFLL